MLKTTVSLEVPWSDDYVELPVLVDYHISGRYYPATRDCPAEYPELDEIHVVSIFGSSIEDYLTDSDWERLSSLCWKDSEGEADDFFLPDDSVDMNIDVLSDPSSLYRAHE